MADRHSPKHFVQGGAPAEHPTGEGKLYLAAVMDVFSKRIVGYAMGERMTAPLPSKALSRAVRDRDPVGTIVHSDRGSQFRSNLFTGLLATHELRGSMGRVGAAGDNAAMESFFALLQKNVLNRKRWATRAELEAAIFRWIEVKYRLPYDTTKAFNFVDLADVAEAAALVITAEDHDGATYVLGGPESLSVDEVARLAGQVLGEHVPSERIHPAVWADGPGAGLEPRVREWLLAMFDYYDHYGLPCGPVPLETLLGRRSTDVRTALQREL